MSASGRQRLTSWKEIAAYLGRDVRTVLRWQKDRGLPVRRIPGTTGRVVFAYTDDLDAWARGDLNHSSDTPVAADAQPGAAAKAASNRRHWIAAAAVLVFISAGTAAVWLRTGERRANEIAKVTFDPPLLRAMAADGRTMWTYSFPELTANQAHTFVLDLDGDGHNDVLAGLGVTPSSGEGRGSAALVALDHRGRKIWQQSIGDTLTFGAGRYSGPWSAEAFLLYEAHGERFVAVAVHHHTWWPGMLVVFNRRGERTGTFVNSGWIRAISASPDGRYLVAGGMNNARNGAAFAILDARHPGGASPEGRGSPYECTSCGAATPLRYYVVPWPDIIDPTLPISAVRMGQADAFADGSFQLRAVEQEGGEGIIELTSSYEMKARRVSDGFWDWHLRFERAGVLTHDRQHCPFRDGPTLLEWTPARGWRNVPQSVDARVSAR